MFGREGRPDTATGRLPPRNSAATQGCGRAKEEPLRRSRRRPELESNSSRPIAKDAQKAEERVQYDALKEGNALNQNDILQKEIYGTNNTIVARTLPTHYMLMPRRASPAACRAPPAAAVLSLRRAAHARDLCGCAESWLANAVRTAAACSRCSAATWSAASAPAAGEPMSDGVRAPPASSATACPSPAHRRDRAAARVGPPHGRAAGAAVAAAALGRRRQRCRACRRELLVRRGDEDLLG